MCWAWNK